MPMGYIGAEYATGGKGCDEGCCCICGGGGGGGIGIGGGALMVTGLLTLALSKAVADSERSIASFWDQRRWY